MGLTCAGGIVSQLSSATWTLSFAEEKFRAIHFNRLVGIIKLDIAAAAYGDTDAASARLQWWISGMLKDDPDWLQDCSLVFEMQSVNENVPEG